MFVGYGFDVGRVSSMALFGDSGRMVTARTLQVVEYGIILYSTL